MTLLIWQLFVVACFSHLAFATVKTVVNEKEKSKYKMADEDDTDICPVKNARFPVLLPHFKDCSNFYICDNGIPHLQTCQAGLHFNAKLKACDYPEKAQCETGVTEKPQGRVVDEDGLKLCPSKNSVFPVFISHPTDCSKFYICDAGSPHLKICQSGLHFNPKLKACDYPETAGCDEGVTEKPRGRMVDEDDLEMCPARNSKFPVLAPHPTDCSKFYICDTGFPHLKTCQSGLHFNPKLQACDYPENSGCGEEMTSIQASSSFPSPFCPPVNGRVLIFFRNPSNCSVYYMCSHGYAYEFTCPARLHFNLRTKMCDYEENAKCSVTNF